MFASLASLLIARASNRASKVPAEEFRVVGGVGAGDELRQQIFRDPQVAGGQSFL